MCCHTSPKPYQTKNCTLLSTYPRQLSLQLRCSYLNKDTRSLKKSYTLSYNIIYGRPLRITHTQTTAKQ